MSGALVSYIINVQLFYVLYFPGKVWLATLFFLRFFILLFAGLPLYWDEDKKFTCNTIHPGCTNVCLDLFSPFSYYQFIVLHLIFVSLPTVMYVTHQIHTTFNVPSGQHFPLRNVPGRMKLTARETKRNHTGWYQLHLVMRMFLELAFGVGQYFVYGISVRRNFLCLEKPCSPAVECFVSHPTEKSLLLQWMLGNAGLSVILTLAEMLFVLRCSIRQKDGQKVKREEIQRRRMSEIKWEKEKIRFSWEEVPENLGQSLPPTSSPKTFRKRMAGDDLRNPLNVSRFEHSGGKIKPWVGKGIQGNGHCNRNNGAKAPSIFNEIQDEPRIPTPLPRHHRPGKMLTVTMTAEHHTDSSEDQDNKSWT